jgi:hypothetical protein
MPMNVREALLHDPKVHQLQVCRQSFQTFGYIQDDPYFAPCFESLDVPTQTGFESHFIEQRWMKQVGGCTQLVGYSPSDFFTFVDLA